MSTLSHLEIIGLDVSCDWLDLHCLSDSRPPRLPNTDADHAKLERMALDRTALVCFEATGGHEWRLWERLEAAGIDAHQLTPAQVKALGRSRGTLHPFPSCAGDERRLRAAPVVARWRSRGGGRGLRQAGCVAACPAAGCSLPWSFICCMPISPQVRSGMSNAGVDVGSGDAAECRRAGAGRFGLRPRPGGRMQTGARCRRVRDSFLSGNRVTENKTSTLPASARHHP